MQGHPDPRLNLALTMERAGRVDDAFAEYRAALEVYPGHIQTMQAMSRCLLRHRWEDARDDTRLRNDLREIALRGDSDLWRERAKEQRIRLDSQD